MVQAAERTYVCRAGGLNAFNGRPSDRWVPKNLPPDRTSMRSTRAVTVAAALILATACRDSSGPASNPDVLPSAIAGVAGDAAVEDGNVIYTQLGTFGVPIGDIQRVGPWQGNCPFDAGSGRFVCAPQARENLTITRSYAFRDAAGLAQSAYDAQ